MRGGSISAAAIALAVSATLWHFGSPHWTLNQLRTAAEARDTATLASLVDFPALRASLRGDDGAPPIQPKPEWLDLERLASPEGIATIFAAESGRAGTAQEPPLDLGDQGFAIERAGFSTFRVLGRTDAGAAALVFRREGYVWKLAAIDLPPAALAAMR